jgi:hypothetical protein
MSLKSSSLLSPCNVESLILVICRVTGTCRTQMMSLHQVGCVVDMENRVLEHALLLFFTLSLEGLPRKEEHHGMISPNLVTKTWIWGN